MLNRLKLAAILILFEIVSYFVLSIAPRDDSYCVIAGAFSFLIIPVIAKVGSDQLVIDMLKLALIVLIFQFIGLLIYHFDLNEKVYNWAIHILLSLQFLRLLIVRKNDGVEQNNNFVHLLRGFNNSRGRNLC